MRIQSGRTFVNKRLKFVIEMTINDEDELSPLQISLKIVTY